MTLPADETRCPKCGSTERDGGFMPCTFGEPDPWHDEGAGRRQQNGEAAQLVVLSAADHGRTAEGNSLSGERISAGTGNPVDVGSSPTFSTNQPGAGRRADTPHDLRNCPAMRALESLTPGGSEYVDDIPRCVEAVRESRQGMMSAMCNMKRNLAAAAPSEPPTQPPVTGRTEDDLDIDGDAIVAERGQPSTEWLERHSRATFANLWPQNGDDSVKEACEVWFNLGRACAMSQQPLPVSVEYERRIIRAYLLSKGRTMPDDDYCMFEAGWLAARIYDREAASEPPTQPATKCPCVVKGKDGTFEHNEIAATFRQRSTGATFVSCANHLDGYGLGIDDWERIGLAAAAPTGQWVSTEERLPDRGCVVMIATNEKHIEVGWVVEIQRDKLAWVLERTDPQDTPIEYEVRSGFVTHWQPLPAPPVD